jgi:Asp-tRNA(Asn)/Glu-tRNA(Gln) amidotransferase A subunit family amidase
MATTVEACEDAMRALAPGFGPTTVALEELNVGVAWTESADPLVRARVEETATGFPNRTRLELPEPDDTYDATYVAFMHEAADVHRELFAEHADSYGDNVRPKIEACLAVTDADAERARAAREELRERFLEATEAVDLLLTPTIPFVAPPADADEIAFRRRGISLTYPFSCLGWPALALPCGAAENGLPASAQLVGKPGDDARVLAAGASLVRGTAAA